MRRINPSTLDPKKLMHSIGNKLKTKEKLKFSNLAKTLEKAFDNYDNNLNRLEKIQSLTLGVNDKDFLISLYCKERKDIKILWEDLKKANGGIDFKCPICGIDSICQLDHYMPKSLFPEFSVHCHNLIPVCAKCNNKKKELWLDTNKCRLFFNAYYDNPKDVLEAVVSISNNNTPIVNLSYLYTKNNWTIQERTIDQLDLLQRISDQLTQELNNETNRIINGFNSKYLTKDDYISLHIDTYQKLVVSKNISEIQNLLYKGLIGSVDYFNWIKQQLI